MLNFWSAECPWVERTDREFLLQLTRWGEQVNLLTVAPNPNESVELLREISAARRLPLVLHDPHQSVANLYGAQTTPHIFVIDPFGVLRYQGAFDDVTFRNRTPTKNYVDMAIAAVQAGRNPDPESTPAYGCAIVRYS